MSPPSQPALCEVAPNAQPCGELIGLREKVRKQEQRINAALDGNADTATALRTVADRVGVMRPDGTSTPHSLTAAVQANTNEVLELRRTIERQSTTDPPPLLDTDDEDVGVITRVDIQRPVQTSRRLRAAKRQRNWIAVGAGIGATIFGVIETLKLLGVLK